MPYDRGNIMAVQWFMFVNAGFSQQENCSGLFLRENNYQVYFYPSTSALHPAPPSKEVKERVELYLYSPSGPSWLVYKMNSSFAFTFTFLVLFSFVTVNPPGHIYTYLLREGCTVQLAVLQTVSSSLQ